MLFVLSTFKRGVPVNPMNVAFGNNSSIASWSLPVCERWHSSTKTKISPLAWKSEGKFLLISFMYSSTSSLVVGLTRPNLWINDPINHSSFLLSWSIRSLASFARWISSSTPLKTRSICSSSSTRSVSRSTRESDIFSRIHLASHTIVRLFPDPWVCQMMPPSWRLT